MSPSDPLAGTRSGPGRSPERRTLLLVVAVASAALTLFVVAAFTVMAAAVSSSSGRFDMGTGKVKVGVVEVKGMIGSPDAALKDLRRFEDREDVKAIVVRVDSPGGAVAPSQEIHDAIARIAKQKPVVVSMGNVAASGGYYLSVAATKIFAEPGTLTGSIGVIAELPEVDRLLDWAHLGMNVVKSGKLKDLGSPFRPMTDDDRKYFQGLIDDVYGQFLDAVVKGRKLPADKVKPIADGRVLSGAQAKALGLVDELGGFEDAAQAAVSLAHETGKPRLVYPPEEMEFRLSDFVKQASGSAVAGLRDAAEPPLGLLFLAPSAAGAR
ncbi:MAG: signal peptide peptidase SppA [Myxococcales bacterium]